MNRFNTANLVHSMDANVLRKMISSQDDDDTPLDVVELMEKNLQLHPSREQRQRFDFIERYS